MFSSFGYTEILLFGIIALMLFGSRLPEMARNFGRTYREMRKKVDDLQREFRDWDKVDNIPSQSSHKSFIPSNEDSSDKQSTTAPKFVPPKDDE